MEKYILRWLDSAGNEVSLPCDSRLCTLKKTGTLAYSHYKEVLSGLTAGVHPPQVVGALARRINYYAYRNNLADDAFKYQHILTSTNIKHLQDAFIWHSHEGHSLSVEENV